MPYQVGHDGRFFESLLPHQVYHQQVQGIEEVEGVLGNGALDKAAAAVVYVDGDEGKAGNPAAAKDAGAYDGL